MQAYKFKYETAFVGETSYSSTYEPAQGGAYEDTAEHASATFVPPPRPLAMQHAGTCTADVPAQAHSRKVDTMRPRA